MRLVLICLGDIASKFCPLPSKDLQRSRGLSDSDCVLQKREKGVKLENSGGWDCAWSEGDIMLGLR